VRSSWSCRSFSRQLEGKNEVRIMSSLAKEFAEFAISTRFEDLPPSIVHESKRLLLDSIGCALGGMRTAPGEMAISLAKRLGGPPESSIIGVNGKVSCSGAALANGQLINALDYDAVTAGGHAPPYIVAGVLAMAESTDASGKELILANALGFEISARVSNALHPVSPSSRHGLKRQDRQGYANCNFGVAAGAGKLLKLNTEKMINALGLAGHMCQVLTWQRFNYSATISGTRPMSKYGMPGWQNTGGIMASLLADMGYMGDAEVFDDEEGFWKFAGYSQWNSDIARKDLGKAWSFKDTPYKPYPSCGVLHCAIDCFLEVMEKNHLQPENVEKVKVFRGQFSFPGAPGPIKGPELTNVVDFQFGLPYILAVIAYGVKIGPEWQDMDKMKDPRVQDFAKKVVLQANPEYAKRPSLNIVEVVAKGETFRSEKTQPLYGRGGEKQLSDEQLAVKFRGNASRILAQTKIDRAIGSILNLEKMTSINEVMKQFTP
jgi:2-methylcitrate dehydratase PrpD